MANALFKYLPKFLRAAPAPTNLVPANIYGGYPGSGFFTSFSKSGENVTEATSKQLSAYYASGRNICEDIAKMPYIVTRTEQNGNKTRVTNIAAYQLLNKAPNTYSIPFDFKYSILNDAIYRGNGFGKIDRSTDGFIKELHYIDSKAVTQVMFDEVTRTLWYSINYTPLNLSGWYSSDEIFHIKGPGNGMIGQSVLAFQLQSLGKALAIQNYSSNYFSNGASMSGLITFDGVSDEKKLQTYINMFLDSFTKGGIAGGPAGMKFEQMNNDPQKSQFNETEQLMVREIARWFRMPLSKLQDQSQSNNNSLEQDNINYVTDCLMPWITRFEQEADKKLFASYERESFDGAFDTEMLLRGDSAAMERKVRTLFTSGGATPNEIRKFYGLNTIDNDASNVNYIPSNLMPATETLPFWQGQALKNTTPPQSEPGAGGLPQ